MVKKGRKEQERARGIEQMTGKKRTLGNDTTEVSMCTPPPTKLPWEMALDGLNCCLDINCFTSSKDMRERQASLEILYTRELQLPKWPKTWAQATEVAGGCMKFVREMVVTLVRSDRMMLKSNEERLSELVTFRVEMVHEGSAFTERENRSGPWLQN